MYTKEAVSLSDLQKHIVNSTGRIFGKSETVHLNALNPSPHTLPLTPKLLQYKSFISYNSFLVILEALLLFIILLQGM